MKIPASITTIPAILIKETSSFKNFIDPSVVNRKTIVANIGYARERSLNVRTLSHIKNEKPYIISPINTNGLKTTLEMLAIIFEVSAAIPPVRVTPVLSNIFAVTFIATLVNSRA